MLKIELKNSNLFIDGRQTFLFGGSFHYWRIKKELWSQSIDKLVSCNFNFVESYIPWVWHETEEGRFDFSGRTLPNRDLIEYLELLKKKDLYLIARPGPYIYSEYQGLGIPLWLIEKHPEYHQKSSSGHTHPHLFAYNHPTYLGYVEKWYDKVFEVLKPYLGNPIIAIQIDNETGLMLSDAFLSPTPNPRDCSEHTTGMLREWLKKKYGTAEELNKVWGTRFNDFSSVEPPVIRGKSYKLMTSPIFNLPAFMDFQEFLEDWIVEYLGTLKKMLEKHVDGKVPFVLNDAAMPTFPANSRKKVTELGIPAYYDIYAKNTSLDATFDFPFMPCTGTKIFENYRLDGPVMSMETGIGWFSPLAKVKIEETIQKLALMVAHSCKGINIYIAQDGIEADGTPYIWPSLLDENGKETYKYPIIKEFASKVLTEELMNSEEVLDDVAVLEYFPNHRLVETGVLELFRDIGTQQGMVGMLHMAGYNPPIIDLEMADVDRLKKYRVLFISTKGCMDEGNFSKLVEYVSSGGVLITAPEPINKNLQGAPLGNLFSAKKTKTKVFHYSNLIMNSLSGMIFWRASPTFRKIQKERPWQLQGTDAPKMIEKTLRMLSGDIIRVDYSDGKFPASILINYFEGNFKPLMKHRGKPVAFVHEYGKGKVVTIGTVLGAHLAGTGFYELSGDDFSRYQKLADELMAFAGVRKKVSSTEPIEVVCRKSEAGTLLFLINRGGRKGGALRLSKEIIDGKYEVDKIYSLHNSSVDAGNDGLKYKMDEDDVLVVRLTNV